MSLQLYNLSHAFHQHMPEWPSSPGVNVTVNKFHAKDGVYQVNWEGIMHRCTHMDAPIHVTENTPGIGEYPLWRLCGTGVAVSIPKGKWGAITPEDLEAASPAIQEGDIVMINTGFHHKWADSDEYFAYGCGISGAGAQWLVDKKVKCVGYGCQANDHPIATKVGGSRPRTIPAPFDRGVQGRHRSGPQRGFSGLGACPQNPDGQGRYPGYRKYRRRPGQGHWQALLLHGFSLAMGERGRLHCSCSGGSRSRPDISV
jgi:kynurenine formamidase